MMEDKFCFLDTNILIYASDSHSPWHQPANEKIKKLLSEGFRLFISPQSLLTVKPSLPSSPSIALFPSTKPRAQLRAQFQMQGRKGREGEMTTCAK